MLLGVLLVAGCGSVETIGPPESSGENWTTGDGVASDTDTVATTGSGTGVGTDAASTGGSSSGSSGSSSGAQGDSTGGSECSQGELGCACLPMDGCADGLICNSGFCVVDMPCPAEEAGMETCQCTPGGGCDEGLVCASDRCVDPNG